jgi:hypothetical protein
MLVCGDLLKLRNMAASTYDIVLVARGRVQRSALGQITVNAFSSRRRLFAYAWQSFVQLAFISTSSIVFVWVLLTLRTRC